jgi:hypothetical protein
LPVCTTPHTILHSGQYSIRAFLFDVSFLKTIHYSPAGRSDAAVPILIFLLRCLFKKQLLFNSYEGPTLKKIVWPSIY